MKNALVKGLAVCALGVVAPLAAQAQAVYVPIIEPLAADGSQLKTELWISNYDTVERPYAATFLAAESDGTERSLRTSLATLKADEAHYIDKAAPRGETGLLEVDAADGMLVDAWVQTKSPRGTLYITGVPLITPALTAQAGVTAYLNGLGHESGLDLTGLSLVNVGKQASTCQVDFVRLDGSLVGGHASLDVPALSLRKFDDSLGLRSETDAASAKITCDQPFYAFATTLDRDTHQVSFVTPDAAVAPAKARKGDVSNAIVFERSGLFHSPTTGKPKGTLRIPVPNALVLSSITVDMNFKVGPWNRRQVSGNHGLLYMHRGKFRSNTITNINAMGPNKNLIRMNQNLDLPARGSTNAKAGFPWVNGRTYGFRFVYDAAIRKVRMALVDDQGTVLRTLQNDATVRNIRVEPTGLVAEFSHNNGQHLPEVSTPPGWEYRDFRVVMFLRK